MFLKRKKQRIATDSGLAHHRLEGQELLDVESLFRAERAESRGYPHVVIWCETEPSKPFEMQTKVDGHFDRVLEENRAWLPAAVLRDLMEELQEEGNEMPPIEDITDNSDDDGVQEEGTGDGSSLTKHLSSHHASRRALFERIDMRLEMVLTVPRIAIVAFFVLLLALFWGFVHALPRHVPHAELNMIIWWLLLAAVSGCFCCVTWHSHWHLVALAYRRRRHSEFFTRWMERNPDFALHYHDEDGSTWLELSERVHHIN